MYSIGDYVVYGTRGVCQVTDIGPVGIESMDLTRDYYNLQPVYSTSNNIFCPVDNTKVIIRPILSVAEANELIESIPELESIEVVVDKQREAIYKESFATCDCKELIRIIKTIYYRRIERMNEGKKITALDERYFKMAEDNLYGELALSLGVERQEVSNRISAQLAK